MGRTSPDVVLAVCAEAAALKKIVANTMNVVFMVSCRIQAIKSISDANISTFLCDN
jgi:hypothetical protein